MLQHQAKGFYPQWSEIQKMDNKAYMEYFHKSYQEGRKYRFLQGYDQCPTFVYGYYVMHINNNNYSYGIAPINSPTHTKYKPLMLSEDQFLACCREFGVNQEELKKFMIDKDQQVDWQNF